MLKEFETEDRTNRVQTFWKPLLVPFTQALAVAMKTIYQHDLVYSSWINEDYQLCPRVCKFGSSCAKITFSIFLGAVCLLSKQIFSLLCCHLEGSHSWCQIALKGDRFIEGLTYLGVIF